MIAAASHGARIHCIDGDRRCLGDAVEPEALYRRALAMKEELLGPEHPDTALTAMNYASLLCELGRIEEACRLAAHAFRGL